MKKVTLDEILGSERYERLRDDFRRHIIAVKKERRVTVGQYITLGRQERPRQKEQLITKSDEWERNAV